MIRILTSIVLLISIGCNSNSDKEAIEKKNLMQYVNNFDILISSGQSMPAQTLEVDSIHYTVVLDGNDTSKYLFVSTSDTDFVTETLSVNKTLNSFHDNEIIVEKGWATYIPLENGWNAVLELDSSQTYVLKDTTVIWFFKRNVPKVDICPECKWPSLDLD